MKHFKYLLWLLLFPALLHGQNYQQRSATAIQNANGYARLVPNATVTLCVYNSQLQCSTPVTIYSDPNLGFPITYPFHADGNGNYNYFTNAGTYVEQVCAPFSQCYTLPITLIASSSGGGGATFQVNGTNLLTSSLINFENSAATNGLTFTFTNASGGNIQLGVSGTLTNAGLANSSTTVNGQTCTLGSTCTVTGNTTSALTMNNSGSGAASGSVFNGSTPVTLSYNTLGAQAALPSGAANDVLCYATSTTFADCGTLATVLLGGSTSTTTVQGGSVTVQAVASAPAAGNLQIAPSSVEADATDVTDDVSLVFLGGSTISMSTSQGGGAGSATTAFSIGSVGNNFWHGPSAGQTIGDVGSGGYTNLIIFAGSSQSTNPIMRWCDAETCGGTVYGSFLSSGFTLNIPLTLSGISGSTQCLHVNSSGLISGTGSDCGSGGGAVSSVSNSNGTLTISPTTGAVVASLALGHANTWTALQTFGTSISIGGVTPTGATGSGNIVFSAAPTFTGTITGASLTLSGTPTFTGIEGVGTYCVQVSPTGVLSNTGAACGSGSGAVNSVTNSDGTLTISPTTGAVVASLALGHANTWTGNQTGAKWIASTGFDISGATTAGHYLRNNGTDFVDSAIQVADVPTLNQNTTGTAANLTGCTPSTAGSICYWNGSAWTLLVGNTTTTNYLQETSAGVPSWTSPGGGVSSVSNSDGTLTISPTTGAVVASLALGHANTWSGLQTFGASDASIGTTAHGLLISEGAAAVGEVAVCGTNFPIIGQTTADPICSTIAYPATVSSGGVLYGSSATAISSSAALPAGDFMLGGGAGSSPTATFSIVTAAKGGTGVANTATLTLGTSNQNWATLGTGIVKNTTTTGALSDAASADVIGLWTGSCSSTTFLRGDGACATGTTAWSAITNPTTTLALSMGNSDTTTWTVGAATSTNNMFTWVDTASNTGTGILGRFTTASSSTMIPWQADANGVGWQITDTGSLASVGSSASGSIQLGGSSSGTVTVTVQAAAGTPTVTFGTNSGTPAVTASSPLVITTATGNIACATCVTSAASLTSNSVVLGGGSQASKTVAGFTTDGTSVLTLGVAGTSVGGLALNNATSGTITINPATGALGSVTATLPANTGTIAELNLAQSWSATQTMSGGDLFYGGVNAQSGTSYAFVTGDENKLVTFNNASATAVTLSQATTAGFTSGAIFYAFNRGAGAVTITPSTSTINGNATLVLNQNQGALLESDGTNYSAWVSSAPSGSGTVTSVAQTFTGGLISVGGSPITTSGTLALTVAGTSGGVPYFNSASTWASSAALGSNLVVLGGGAGAAPKTAAGISSNGTATIILGVAGTSAGNLQFNNATSGSITVTVPTGALGAVTDTLPDTTTTLAGLAVAETFSALQTFGANASIGSTAHGVLVSENTSAAVATSAGALGTFLSGQGASADPTFIALSAINPQTATYQVLASDFQGYKTITAASGTFTITLVASGSQPAAGQYIRILNYGSGVVTVAASGQNINGSATSQTLAAGSASAPTGIYIESDGTNYFAQPFGAGGGGSGTVNSGTAAQVAYYATSTAAVSGSSALNISGAGAGAAVGVNNATPVALLDIGAGSVIHTNGGPSANTTLNGSCTAVATSCTVVSTTGYPATGYLLIGPNNFTEEIVKYTGTSGGTSFTGLTRGVCNGGTGTAQSTGGVVVLIDDGSLECGTNGNGGIAYMHLFNESTFINTGISSTINGYNVSTQLRMDGSSLFATGVTANTFSTNTATGVDAAGIVGLAATGTVALTAGSTTIAPTTPIFATTGTAATAMATITAPSGSCTATGGGCQIVFVGVGFTTVTTGNIANVVTASPEEICTYVLSATKWYCK